MSDSSSPPVSVSRTPVLVRAFAQGTIQVLLTGFVIILPFVIVAFLIGLTLDFTRRLLQPLIAFLHWTGIVQMANVGFFGEFLIALGFYNDLITFLGEFIAVLTLLSVVVTLGVFASFRSGEQALEYVDHGVAAIPGLGPIYESFRRLGNIILEDGLEEFQSVKLVEFPQPGCYSLAFETSHAPESIQTVTEEADIVSLFVPLAPNPVVGGFLIHVPRERVFDVDMSVEEAGRAIITSGFAAGEESHSATPSMSPVDD